MNRAGLLLDFSFSSVILLFRFDIYCTLLQLLSAAPLSRDVSVVSALVPADALDVAADRSRRVVPHPTVPAPAGGVRLATPRQPRRVPLDDARAHPASFPRAERVPVRYPPHRAVVVHDDRAEILEGDSLAEPNAPPRAAAAAVVVVADASRLEDGDPARGVVRAVGRRRRRWRRRRRDDDARRRRDERQREEEEERKEERRRRRRLGAPRRPRRSRSRGSVLAPRPARRRRHRVTTTTTTTRAVPSTARAVAPRRRRRRRDAPRGVRSL
ncbi:uncharacterized protein MICPUCDRAFT_62683 [Micromonas pusilla CCMP1545]|uniref:Predicted protein n=1 Tax=Micromonas pusilla (strain CCMP1545) TaxID=564608 RepID=C1MN54_MICPC|nr:uncharacterized protein MICPUCDRAFT_62683 [Micromonas pusilla CCMP1545]EEH59165.1 predicted protein [Micromonas pusilla CCMP1545]|eukprot:XP_003057520.1 predicted protein [Micromonas pusilla CCMP1545]